MYTESERQVVVAVHVDSWGQEAMGAISQVGKSYRSAHSGRSAQEWATINAPVTGCKSGGWLWANVGVQYATPCDSCPSG